MFVREHPFGLSIFLRNKPAADLIMIEAWRPEVDYVTSLNKCEHESRDKKLRHLGDTALDNYQNNPLDIIVWAAKLGQKALEN